MYVWGCKAATVHLFHSHYCTVATGRGHIHDIRIAEEQKAYIVLN